MALSNIWVVAEPSNGSFTTTSLELLTQARTFGASISAITWGGDAALAAVAGDYGATTLYDVGDLGGRAARRAGRLGDRGAGRIGRRARRHPHPRPATTAATSPDDSRLDSTARSSRT